MRILPAMSGLRARHRQRNGSLLLLGMLVSVLTVTGPAAPARVATSAEATSSPALERPNVVVLVTDDQAWDSLTYRPIGYPEPMPYLSDRLTDAADHWVTFNNAFVNTALCCPSRATILSGQNSHHTGVLNQTKGSVFRDSSTFATWLRAAGYYTGYFGKHLNGWPWARGNVTPPGWDQSALYDYRIGSERFYDYGLVTGGTVERHGSAPGDYLTDVLAAKALDFLRAAPTDKPFLLYLTPIAGHHPWTAAPRDVNRYAGAAPVRRPSFNEDDVSDKPAWLRALPKLTARQVASWDGWRRKAMETLPAADAMLENVMRTLADQGRLDNTVVIVTSDHGHTWGEHRVTKKKCPYDECSRVPFAVRYPGATTTSVDQVVGNTDIAPTLAQLAGATPTIKVDGLSLVPLLQGQSTPWREGVLLRHYEAVCSKAAGPCMPPYWGVRTADYTYVEYENGERELYDLTGRIGPADPHQLENRAGSTAYVDIRAGLSAMIVRLRN